MKKLEDVVQLIIEQAEAENNLKKWFGKSILKHEDGTPQAFYHGTGHDIPAFDHKWVGQGNDAYGSGFYFASNPDLASGYASDAKGEHKNVMKVHLKVEHPIHPDDQQPLKRQHIEKLITSAPNHLDSLMNFGDVDYEGYHKVLRSAVDANAENPRFNTMNAIHNDFYNGHSGEFLKNFKKITKHDGVVMKLGEHTIVNVFDPTHIKSAIGNVGTYNPKSPVVTESTEYLPYTREEALLPQEHITALVHGNAANGFRLTSDIKSPFIKSKDSTTGGVERELTFKHADGRARTTNIRFAYPENRKTNVFSMKDTETGPATKKDASFFANLPGMRKTS